MLKHLSQIEYSITVNILVFLFPIVILGRETWGAYILNLLTILGVYVVFRHGINPFKQKQLKLVSIITTAYFSSILLFILVSDNSLKLLKFTGGEYYFLFAPLIALSIYKANIDFNRLILAIKIGLTVLGIVILYRSTEITYSTDRVLWVSHIGVMLLVFSWININHENKYNLLLTFISSTLALNAIMLAGTRGPLLAFVILSISFIYLNKQQSVGKHRNKIFAVVLIIMTTSLMLINDNTRNRFSVAIVNLSTWLEISDSDSDIESNMNTSIGQRMEMYKAGLLVVKDRPILGHGYNNTTIPASKYATKKAQQFIIQHTHLHNTYINTLVYGGVIALSITLTLLFLPLKIFWHDFNTRSNAKYASLGILLIVSYGVLGTTDTMFGGVFENTFFVFFLSILLPNIIDE